VTAPDIAEIIDAHTEQLMALDDVVAVGESRCDGQPCIKVLLRTANPNTSNAMPARLDGILVVSEVSGEFNAGL
jgi:hypothetical protein